MKLNRYQKYHEEMCESVRKADERARESFQKYVNSQDYIMKLETDIKRMHLDLKAYKEYLSGVHDNLVLDNDRKTEKIAREIKQSGHNINKQDLLR